MEYLPEPAHQLEGFLYSLGLGFALSAVYDVFSLVFTLFSRGGRIGYALRDFGYTFVCFVATFVFLLVICSGEIVMYALVGEVIGWFVYRYTVSAVFYSIFETAAVKIRRIFLKMNARIAKLFTKLNEKLKKSKKV